MAPAKSLIGIVNDTKWEELRLAMHNLGDLSPAFRVKSLDSDLPWTGWTEWDREWYYHFREGGYRSIRWVDLKVTSEVQREAVRFLLKAIHMPGEQTEDGFRIYGWIENGQSIEYIL